jgi:DNA modification methylase
VNGPERNQILIGDVRDRLRQIPDGAIDCVITSPPYYQLRNYGSHEQIGLEGTVEEWAEVLRGVLADIGRVLKPSGSVWLNLGDSYSGHLGLGAPPKSLLLGPERVALALLDDGWLIRNKVVWAKRNPMPSSVRDRLSPTWEVLYLLTRSPRYFFDLDAIRVPHTSRQTGRPGVATPVYPPPGHGAPHWASEGKGGNKGLAALRDRGVVGHPLGKNPGDVWRLATASFRGQHFATFPRELVERPLLATCPERVCAGCGSPWESSKRQLGGLAVRGQLVKRCPCDRGWRPGLVLDPFLGSGTVALVADAHRRDWLGIELNPVFAQLAKDRVKAARIERNADTETGESARLAA